MGCDAAGNRYYENRIDYPFGQHRWVEPGDIHNFDSSSIPPEWHGWMTSQNDVAPHMRDKFIAERTGQLDRAEHAHTPGTKEIPVGHQETYFNFHHMHNQSQVRSRGYKIGNPVVGLPPDAPDAFYTQPGSPYNSAFRRPKVVEGELPGGRKYKSDKWKLRLMTPEEHAQAALENKATQQSMIDAEQLKLEMRRVTRSSRGAGTVLAPRKK
ncbi:MAG: NADH-ubiquinone oxidoreductase subunit NDUFA12 family protein [Myxococcota bacterium]